MKIVDALMTLGLAVVAGSLAPVPSVGQGTPTTSKYRYTIVDYPGSASACLSINTRLDVICDALFNQELPFIYDARSGRITLPAVAPPAGWSAAAFGINDSSTVVVIEGVVSGTFIDGSGDAHGFIARPKECSLFECY